MYPGDLVADGFGKAKQRPDAPYYCLISTLNPEGTEKAYRYEAFDLDIPQGWLNQAEQNNAGKQWVTVRLGSPAATARTEADSDGTGGAVVRLAQCRVPASPKIVNNIKPVLKKFGPQSWLYGQRTSSPKTSAARSGGCNLYLVTYFCYTNPPPRYPESDSRCSEIGRQCVDEDESIDEGEDSDNGGGPSGDESSMCASDTTSSGGGGGTGLTGTDEGLTNEDGAPVSCSDEDPCDTDGEYPALDDPVFQDGMKSLWDRQEEHGYKEQAGYWYENQFGRMQFHVVLGEGVIRTTTRVEFPIPDLPSSGSIYVHTHPSRETVDYKNIVYSNYHNVSDDDVETLTQSMDTIGTQDKAFILDEDKILVYNSDGHIIDFVDRCGY